MTKTFAVALCVCVGLLVAGRVSADTRYETQVISPTTPFGWVGGFGFDGTTLVAATQLDSSYTTRQLRVFQVDADNHLAEQASVVPPAYIADRFGGVLSVSGDFALMGAPTYTLGIENTNMGIASVLQHETLGWSSVGQFFGSGAYAAMGRAVDLNGQRLIVGAPGQRDRQNPLAGSGLAFVATTTTDWNGNWTVSQLMGSGPRYGQFGAAVAVDGDIAVVGAPGDSVGSAAAFIFERNGAGAWSQTARLTGDFADGLFGTSVDVRDGLVVIGDPYDNAGGHAVGAAYAYRKVGGNWVRESKLWRDGAGWFEKFGAAVNIGDDGEILVGLPGYQDVSQRRGAAMVFLPDGPNSWQPSAFLLPSVGSSGGDFGRQVELRNGIAVVSAATEFGYLGPIGAEFIYVLVPEPSGGVLLVMWAMFVSLRGFRDQRSRLYGLDAESLRRGLKSLLNFSTLGRMTNSQ